MRRTNTVIIGGGQAGLALSRCLIDRRIEHVVLERGRTGQRWTERWDSLRLLSPNWMTRLPGRPYDGNDPDGYMSGRDVARSLSVYACSFNAPVSELTTVLAVEPVENEWNVTTTRGLWRAQNVVIATGHCQQTRVPAMAGNLASHIVQMTTSSYRNPDQLPGGAVLIVGASASGVQLADELRRTGRQVVLAVGNHIRLPRRYRGRDSLEWLDRIGSFDRPLASMPDREAARREPSLQLVGTDDGRTIDLATLAADGVRLTGQLVALDGSQARFAADLNQTIARADSQLRALLHRIERYIEREQIADLPAADPIDPIPAIDAVRELDLDREGIESILWATGYRRSYPWLHADVLDSDGEIIQTEGRTAAPGLYTLGLQFMIRRNSSFLAGVGRDAREIAGEISTRSCGTREKAA
jgi:putative flavoprotein involved in K+ transport